MDHVTACLVCGSSERATVYEGAVRKGRFGEYTSGSITRCIGCGIDRLSSPELLAEDDYRSGVYRALVGEKTDAASFFSLHDEEQFAKVSLLQGVLQRGDIVVDVGCGAGAFLDFVSGVAGRTVAVEPAVSYHESLLARGHDVFADVAGASSSIEPADLVVSFSVIEHVSNPLHFVSGIRSLMKPGGKLVISTPNRDDVLLHCGVAEYRSFFYRLVHRFYFDEASLTELLRRSSFRVKQVHYRQRFGFANFVAWVRDRRPTGQSEASVLPAGFDARWRHELEEAGRADYLYMIAEAY